MADDLVKITSEEELAEALDGIDFAALDTGQILDEIMINVVMHAMELHVLHTTGLIPAEYVAGATEALTRVMEVIGAGLGLDVSDFARGFVGGGDGTDDTEASDTADG